MVRTSESLVKPPPSVLAGDEANLRIRSRKIPRPLRGFLLKARLPRARQRRISRQLSFSDARLPCGWRKKSRFSSRQPQGFLVSRARWGRGLFLPNLPTCKGERCLSLPQPRIQTAMPQLPCAFFLGAPVRYLARAPGAPVGLGFTGRAEAKRV